MATILYIGDEIDLRHDVAEELTDEGHEVLTACRSVPVGKGCGGV